MATYIVLNIVVLAAVWLALWQKPKRPSRPWLVTFVALLILTFVFDNLLIWLDVYSYASSKILGIHIGLAPVEDFMYVLLAAIVVPAIWHKLGVDNV